MQTFAYFKAQSFGMGTSSEEEFGLKTRYQLRSQRKAFSDKLNQFFDTMDSKVEKSIQKVLLLQRERKQFLIYNEKQQKMEQKLTKESGPSDFVQNYKAIQNIDDEIVSVSQEIIKKISQINNLYSHICKLINTDQVQQDQLSQTQSKQKNTAEQILRDLKQSPIRVIDNSINVSNMINQANVDFEFPSAEKLSQLCLNNPKLSKNFYISQIQTNKKSQWFQGCFWKFTSTNGESTQFNTYKNKLETVNLDQHKNRIGKVDLLGDEYRLRGMIFWDAQGSKIAQIGCTTATNKKTICLEPKEKIIGVKGKLWQQTCHEIVAFQFIILNEDKF